MISDTRSVLPRCHEPDPADLAAFTVDAGGRITGWPDAAARLAGQPAGAAIGCDVCDVLLTDSGQRDLIGQAMAEVAAGRTWSATVAGGRLGDDRFVIRCEPLTAGPGVTTPAEDGGPGAMVVVRRVWPQPGPGWLTAAARIGGTLDLGQTAADVVGIAVPAFADAAALYVAEHLHAVVPSVRRPSPGMTVRRLAGRLSGHSSADAETLLPAGEVITFDPGTPGFQAMSGGQPVIFRQLDEQTAERLSRRPGGRQLAASYGSFLAVPLITQATLLGCLTFGRTTASPPFSPGEVPQARELASQAAAGVENALLYNRERRTALALQHGLLPRQPDTPPQVEIAHRYLPAGSAIVGGDWHDVIALPGGRTAVVVGDAMGHGPEAAAAMVQLRTAANVLADLELSPREILRKLDRLVAAVIPAPFATCICAIIDPLGNGPGTGQLCLASRAGHPPPVFIAPDGSARLLDLPAGLPLGLGETRFEETIIGLPAGATLAFYTDGLIETRARPIDQGLAELCDALGSALTTPEAALDTACESVTQQLSRHAEDDILLLLARIS